MSYDGIVYYLILFRQWLMSSVLFKRTNIIHNLPVTCNDWHFTNTWKAFGWQHHFAHKTSLSPPPLIEVPVPNQKSQRSSLLFIEVPVPNQKSQRSSLLFIEVPVPNQKVSDHRYSLLKCLYQIRKVSDHRYCLLKCLYQIRKSAIIATVY